MKCVNLLVVLALVLALTLFFPFPSQVHAETEPNDTPGQANPIGIGWENAEINATISSTSDVDYFKFVACAGCTYVIEDSPEKRWGFHFSTSCECGTIAQPCMS